MTRAPRRTLPFPAGARIFLRMYTRMGLPGRPPHFVTEFFPYAGLTNTIRLREETAFVRISDLLRRAPLAVHEAAAAVLLARLYRRRTPREYAERYRSYLVARATQRRLEKVRRRRARPAAGGSAGRHHDLAPLFDRLNRRYFGGALPRVELAWSARAWRRQLGIFDPALGQIVLNARLDRRDVPRYAVAYVLFHEMLHVKHPLRRAGCSLQAHSPAFRREERRFRDYRRARRLFDRLA